MRYFLKIIMILMLHIQLLSAYEVKVGAYLFPPFLDYEDDRPVGLIPDLITLLNSYQHQVTFTLVSTTPQKRYEDFDQDHFDLMLFESLNWGWRNKPVYESSVILTGGEVYVSLSRNVKQVSSHFKELDKYSIGVVDGYHYGFMGYEDKMSKVGRQFHVSYYQSPHNLLPALLSGEVDVIVITASLLQQKIRRGEVAAKKLSISKSYDQLYRHTALLDKRSALPMQKLNAMFAELRGVGALDRLWKRHGIHSNEKIRTYIIGVENMEYYPYYHFAESGIRDSYIKRLLDSFARQEGITFQYEPLPVRRLHQKLARGLVDFKFPAHEAWGTEYKKGMNIHYSKGLMGYVDGTMVPKYGDGATRVRKLGTILGFTPVAYLDQIESDKVKLHEQSTTFEGLIRKLMYSRVDAIYANVDVLLHQIQKFPALEDQIVFDPSLPYVRSEYKMSTVKYPQVLEKLGHFVQENPKMLDSLKKSFQIPNR